MFTQDVTQCASMTCRRKEIFFRRILLTVNPAAFGRNVRRYRGKDTSATELASRLGVGKSLISGWEHGTKGLPQAPTLLRLAKALGVTVDDLLVGVDEDYDRLRSDLVRQGGTDTVSPSTEGGANGPTQAQARVLETRLSDVLSEVREAAIRLAAIAKRHHPRGAETEDTTPATPRRDSRHRTARR